MVTFNLGEAMEKISFVTLAASPYWVSQTVLLAESLRAFGGDLAQSRLSVLIPNRIDPLPQDIIEQLKTLRVEIIQIEVDEQALNFPLGLLPFAAAVAERHTRGKVEQLAWVLPDTLFISAPVDFLLPPEKQLAYRPVHHANIGSDYHHPPDEYWSAVLEHCQVPEAHIFPMQTCTRDKILRPYINAGVLVTRPESGFLENWKQSFQSAYQNKTFLHFLADQRRAIFLHQAVLSGVMMKKFIQDDLLELPESVNYPLHLHDEYPEKFRPDSLNQLITARYETLKELLEALECLTVEPSLNVWLGNKIRQLI
jgi:hypothetical protein